MKVTLDTPLKDITSSNPILSNRIGGFWNEKLVGRFQQYSEGYSAFNRHEKFREWNKLINDGCRVFELFRELSDFYRKEKFQFQYDEVENPPPSSYLSIQMLSLLDKEGLNITKVLLNNQAQDPEDKGGWSYSDNLDMYMKYLEFKQELILDSLLDQFILEIEDKRRYNCSPDEEVDTYFRLLNLIPQSKVTYDWFSKNLELSCMVEDEDSRELVNRCKSLNYDSQKKIQNYVHTYFPEHVEDKKEYYSDLVNTNVFSTKRFYQGTIEVNLFPIMEQNNLKHKNLHHLGNVAKECLNVVASPEFMALINENIPVTNINSDEKSSSIKLDFSTDSYQNLEKFEEILLTALTGVLQVSEKIKMTMTDPYHGAPELITNMNAKFVHQYYLYHKLHDTLDSNAQKAKKPKI
jgi:hypothetical protein